MLKQGLKQKLVQKLSPLQIQTIKLLELPTLELEQRIKKELEENPVLDEANESEEGDEPQNTSFSLSEYDTDEQIPAYKLYTNNQGKDLKPQYNIFSVKESFQQSLLSQLGYSQMTPRSKSIAKFIIGSLDDDGYLRRDLDSLADDIAFRKGITTDEKELESILLKIQEFEPAGVGARDLRECLLIQIRSIEDSPGQKIAEDILRDLFMEFTKKHYQKIISKLSISEDQLREAIDVIVRLNPRPGGQIDDTYTDQAQQVVPDFLLEFKDGELIMTMPRFSVPELKVNKRYADLLLSTARDGKSGKEAATFVKQKLDSAKWFIEAIKQRHNTLHNTMNAILDFQKEYFIDGDETKLKPMVLKNIAEKTGLDISTISRVVNCKYIQTHFGIYPLKYFFSEGLMTDKGEEVSTREIKNILAESIDREDKKNPLTDEELVSVLGEKGYMIARRTVAKYREQLNIPIARLRKEL